MDLPHPPHGSLPHFLRGLRLPATPDEAYVHAQEQGARPEDLAFLEALPAAIFTSEEGLRHAFSELGEHVPREDFRPTTASHDGTSG